MFSKSGLAKMAGAFGTFVHVQVMCQLYDFSGRSLAAIIRRRFELFGF